MIRLSVPGTLVYRDVAMRVVSAAAKLVLPGRRDTQFDAQVVSAFGDAFNNIAMHGYVDHQGEVAVEIEVEEDGLRLRISDHGSSFDPLEVPDPELDDLPERGMGLFIIRNFVDRMVYTPGSPNVLVLEKRCGASKPKNEHGNEQGNDASKSGRGGPSRVTPVRPADSGPARARAGEAPPRDPQPAHPSPPLGGRRE